MRMARARIGVFRGRREQAFDEAVVGAYVAEASMRETTAFLQEVFGTSVSPLEPLPMSVSTLVSCVSRSHEMRYTGGRQGP